MNTSELGFVTFMPGVFLTGLVITGIIWLIGDKIHNTTDKYYHQYIELDDFRKDVFLASIPKFYRNRVKNWKCDATTH